jgi:hypothetical protein
MNQVVGMVINECIKRHLQAEEAIAFLSENESKGLPFDFKLRNELIEQSHWEWLKAEKLAIKYVSINQLINEVL